MEVEAAIKKASLMELNESDNGYDSMNICAEAANVLNMPKEARARAQEDWRSFQTFMKKARKQGRGNTGSSEREIIIVN